MTFRNKSLQRSCGFSLVELLVVIAIIAVLSTLISVAAGTATSKTHTARCLQTLRQAGVAVQLYVGENQGRLPNTEHLDKAVAWQVTLGGYLGPDFIGECPAKARSRAANAGPQAKVDYAWNDYLAETNGEGIMVSRCRTPSSTFAMAEKSDTYTSEHFHFASSRSRITLNKFKLDVGVDRHGGTANYLFVDGHAEALTVSEVKSRLDAANTTFLIP